MHFIKVLVQKNFFVFVHCVLVQKNFLSLNFFSLFFRLLALFFHEKISNSTCVFLDPTQL